jgi:hypothetical protein
MPCRNIHASKRRPLHVLLSDDEPLRTSHTPLFTQTLLCLQSKSTAALSNSLLVSMLAAKFHADLVHTCFGILRAATSIPNAPDLQSRCCFAGPAADWEALSTSCCSNRAGGCAGLRSSACFSSMRASVKLPHLRTEDCDVTPWHHGAVASCGQVPCSWLHADRSRCRSVVTDALAHSQGCKVTGNRVACTCAPGWPLR